MEEHVFNILKNCASFTQGKRGSDSCLQTVERSVPLKNIEKGNCSLCLQIMVGPIVSAEITEMQKLSSACVEKVSLIKKKEIAAQSINAIISKTMIYNNENVK